MHRSCRPSLRLRLLACLPGLLWANLACQAGTSAETRGADAASSTAALASSSATSDGTPTGTTGVVSTETTQAEPAAAAADSNVSPAPAPATTTAAHALCSAGEGRAVHAQTTLELVTALTQATAGDVITVADGTYAGSFTLSAKGTQDQPISICGSGNAILSGESLTTGYTLHLDGAAYCNIAGLQITGGAKGVMLDNAQHNVLQDLTVHDIGSEGIHLRTQSSNNTVDTCSVYNTGRANNPMYGEGIYIGSSQNNWCLLTAGAADQSNNNVVQNCNVWANTAEAIDIKEGTANGIIRNNHLNGNEILASAATSVVNVKGNSYLLQNNVIEAAPQDALSVHVILTGWGACNTFTGNSAADAMPGYGVNMAAAKPWPAIVVKSDNQFAKAALGVTNVPLNGTAPDASACISTYLSVSCAN